MDEQHVSYYAIIPANVRYDEDLTPNAKLLYGEITALCNMKGHCWASNGYFADLYKVSKVSISKWIKQLIDKGYVHSEFKYKDGTKEIEYRYLTIVNGGIKEKLNTPIKEKFKDNNTSFNNTINNNSRVKTSEKAKKVYDENSDEYKLTKLFIDKMKFYTDGVFEGPTNLFKWHNEMRLLIDVTLKNVSEERSVRCKKAQDIILYVVGDDFHRGNVLSIPKLRKRALEFIVKMDAMEKKKQQGYKPYNNYNTNNIQAVPQVLVTNEIFTMGED